MAATMTLAWRGQEASFASTSKLEASAWAEKPCKASARAGLGPITLLGAGAGGVESLSRHLGMGLVSFALLRFQVGHGTFARAKLVAIRCSNAGAAPAALLGRLAARGNEAFQLLGEVHAHLSVDSASELTAEYLCERLLPLFAADAGGHCSVQSLRLEYSLALEQLERSAKASCRPRAEKVAALAASSQEQVTAEEQMTAPEQVIADEKVTAAEALQAVGHDAGGYDWVLLEPARLEVHCAGKGGIEEMKGHLSENQVLFGVLRVSCGDVARLLPQSDCGSTMRKTQVPRQIVRHVLIHWVGPRVGAVQRGRSNARLQLAAAQISAYCNIALRHEVQNLDDLNLKDLVAKLQRLTPAVTMAANGGLGSGPSSAMEHFAALGAAERNVRNSSALPDLPEATEHLMAQQTAAERSPLRLPAMPDIQPPVTQLPELSSAVQIVRQTSGEWDWLLCGWQRPSPAAIMPPSPAQGGA